MPDLSVVIVNWNVMGLLRRCLESLFQKTAGIDFEVFVVDNNSSDGSAGMVRREFPRVRLIVNSTNAGFARANNQAMRQCRGRYVLLLNPDTEIIDNAPGMMVKFMDAHPGVDGLAGMLIYPDGSLQRNCRHFPSLFTDLMESLYLDQAFPRSSFFNRYRMGQWGHDSMREVDQPYGACLLFRREGLEKAGFMDERFFMYYDEVDLCYRIRKDGGKIYFVPHIRVIHHANQSSRQIALECEQWKCRSRLLFFEKHYGRWSPAVMSLNLLVRSMLVWGLFPVLHLLFGRPRDVKYFRGPLGIMWKEYLSFLRYRGQT